MSVTVWAIFILSVAAGGSVPLLVAQTKLHPAIMPAIGLAALVAAVALKDHFGVSLVKTPANFSLLGGVVVWFLKGFFFGSFMSLPRALKARASRGAQQQVPADVHASASLRHGRG